MIARKRLITNTDWFDVANDTYDIVTLGHMTLFDVIAKAKEYTENDVVVLNISSKLLIYFCIAKTLLPNADFLLISIDIILSKPVTIADKIKANIFTYMFNKVNYFIVFMKDWSGYQKYFGIDNYKFKYIPFKINSYDYVVGKKIEDHGYIFTGGVSKRDYNTLFKAVAGLDFKLVVLSPPNTVSEVHGTAISSQSVPDNVTIIHDDGSSKSWVDYMSQARLVVLPIDKDTISPTGVSTYLLAMALKKCVIITDGPATREIVPAAAAIIVPPEDVQSLKEGLIKAYEDHEFRQSVAHAGYNYAMTLKNHERLVGDVLNFIGEISE